MDGILFAVRGLHVVGHTVAIARYSWLRGNRRGDARWLCPTGHVRLDLPDGVRRHDGFLCRHVLVDVRLRRTGLCQPGQQQPCAPCRPRPRTLHLRHGDRQADLRRLLNVVAAQAGLTRTSRRDSNASGAGRCREAASRSLRGGRGGRGRPIHPPEPIAALRPLDMPATPSSRRSPELHRGSPGRTRRGPDPVTGPSGRVTSSLPAHAMIRGTRSRRPAPQSSGRSAARRIAGHAGRSGRGVRQPRHAESPWVALSRLLPWESSRTAGQRPADTG